MLRFFVTNMSVMAQTQHIKTIRELLGIEPEGFALGGSSPPQADHYPPSPTAPAPAEIPVPVTEPAPSLPALPEPEITLSEFGSPLSRFFSRDIVRYPLIFVVALGFFYVILNFGAVLEQVRSWFLLSPGREQQKAFEKISPEYQKWLQKYYVYVSDPQIFVPNNDVDRDGLTNLYEFYLGTNPLKFDTDGDGYDDGREVLNGYNPLWIGRLTVEQEKIIAQNFDSTSITSRKNLQRELQVAGQITSYPTPPTSSSSRLPPLPFDSFQLDPTKPGVISIPKLGIEAPVIWSKEFARMEEDLKYGTAHHPATPYPGQRGTASIHGHSSGNPGDGNFKTVFTKLNSLQAGDEVSLTVYGVRGEERKYRFLVRSQKVYAKNDPAQFADLGGYHLNLSTSWPVGTARQRYVVTIELVGF